MSHFAKVIDGIVTEVIVAEGSFFDTFIDSSPGDWIQTSYNNNIRKNFAGVGFTYDKERDAFIAPQPHSSWVLREDTCQWQAPVACLDDDKIYDWNEETKSWQEVTDE